MISMSHVMFGLKYFDSPLRVDGGLVYIYHWHDQAWRVFDFVEKYL